MAVFWDAEFSFVCLAREVARCLASTLNCTSGFLLSIPVWRVSLSPVFPDSALSSTHVGSRDICFLYSCSTGGHSFLLLLTSYVCRATIVQELSLRDYVISG